jgi:hypothetical protein
MMNWMCWTRAACLAAILSVGTGLAATGGTAGADMRADFADPPAQWKTRPLWFWNAPPDRRTTEAVLEGCRASGYHGFGILPTEKMKLKFMSPVYLDRYEEAVDKAAALGMKVCLYDEFWFPSGAAGGQLAQRHPEALGKRLDLLEIEVPGPGTVVTNLPAGALMAAVALEQDTRQRLNLEDRLRNGTLAWTAPPGRWRIMLFTCVPDGARGLVDYLDPEAVGKFIGLTYEKYYQRLGRHFGRTIDSAFYDEPTFHWVQGGRAWTPSFNQRFQRKHGYSPALLYPALWHDIGPETAAARNALFGFRAELFAEGFVKTLADWCRQHGLELTGHVDQEEVVNPVGLCGDLIKCFQFQPMPGVDQVFQYGRGSKAYKVISSAAVNYDRPLVMTECYGGINNMPVANLYKEAMDQFAKGINVMVPHAVWYSTNDVIFQPELSFRTLPYSLELPAYNRYLGRLQRVLQQGHPVADIGVLYPIAGLQAGYRFGVGKPYEGGLIPAEADYMDVGERLALEVRRDYTFVHPDVLDERCALEGMALCLRHRDWAQRYRVFILPGSKVIRWSNLEKIKRFYDQGGTVIATTALPGQSAEPGLDQKVRQAVTSMFGEGTADPAFPKVTASSGPVRTNAQGGRACFLPRPTAAALRAALETAQPVGDVAFEQDPAVTGGSLSYLHKRMGDTEVYFFANSSDARVNTAVRLRGRLKPELWDPHTGTIAPAEYSQDMVAGEPVCRVQLALPPVRSVFIVAHPEGSRP